MLYIPRPRPQPLSQWDQTLRGKAPRSAMRWNQQQLVPGLENALPQHEGQMQQPFCKISAEIKLNTSNNLGTTNILFGQ